MRNIFRKDNFHLLIASHETQRFRYISRDILRTFFQFAGSEIREMFSSRCLKFPAIAAHALTFRQPRFFEFALALVISATKCAVIITPKMCVWKCVEHMCAPRDAVSGKTEMRLGSFEKFVAIRLVVYMRRKLTEEPSPAMYYGIP